MNKYSKKILGNNPKKVFVDYFGANKIRNWKGKEEIKILVYDSTFCPKLENPFEFIRNLKYSFKI